MGSFRFRRSIKLGPAFRLNLGKTGIGITGRVTYGGRVYYCKC